MTERRRALPRVRRSWWLTWSWKPAAPTASVPGIPSFRLRLEPFGRISRFQVIRDALLAVDDVVAVRADQTGHQELLAVLGVIDRFSDLPEDLSGPN